MDLSTLPAGAGGPKEDLSLAVFPESLVSPFTRQANPHVIHNVDSGTAHSGLPAPPFDSAQGAGKVSLQVP